MIDISGADTFALGTRRVKRVGYGAMQLAGPRVFGPRRTRTRRVAVLREAIATGVDHIDTSDFYGPHVTNQIIKRALHPYPKNLVIVTKVGAKRGADALVEPASLRRGAACGRRRQPAQPRPRRRSTSSTCASVTSASATRRSGRTSGPRSS